MLNASRDSGCVACRNLKRFCRKGGKHKIEFLLLLSSALDLRGDGASRDFSRTVCKNGCIQFPDDESPAGFDALKRRRADEL